MDGMHSAAPISALTFEHYELSIAGKEHRRELLQRRQFVALFGTTSSVCVRAWNLILRNCSPPPQPIYLLWGLLLLKVYATETVLSSMAGVSEKTFRKWAWTAIECLAEIPVVSEHYLFCGYEGLYWDAFTNQITPYLIGRSI